MKRSRILLRNLFSNWVGYGVELITGLLTAPLLVNSLGEQGYGLWMLLVAITAYLRLLNLGVNDTLGRNIAFHRSRNDPLAVNAILGAALTFLGADSILVLLGILGSIPAFFWLFEVPSDQADNVTWALVLLGTTTLVGLWTSVFDATLWAYERFDLSTLIDVPAALFRLALTFLAIRSGHGVVGLAALMLCITLVSGAGKALLCFRLEPGLHFRPGHASRQAAAVLFRFGAWSFLNSVTGMILASIGPVVIGSRLTVSSVTPFSIVTRLVGYAGTFFVISTGVLTPWATALYSQEKQQQQLRMFLDGGKASVSAALFFLALFGSLGGPFIALWMGREINDAEQLLLIVALGEVLPMSQAVSRNMAMAMGRYKALAYLAIVEVALVVSLGNLLIQSHGILGFALAVALSGAVCRGLVPFLYVRRLLSVSLERYWHHAVLPAVTAAVVPAACLREWTFFEPPATWITLIGCAVLYGMVYLAFGGPVLMYSKRIKPQWNWLILIAFGLAYSLVNWDLWGSILNNYEELKVEWDTLVRAIVEIL